MKTVSGKVESSMPIPLSRAAKFLSKFLASDNEASQAFCAYLSRTATAFSELVQLHKELKISDKVKKDLSKGNVSEVTMNSAIIPLQDDLADIMNKQSNSETEKHVNERGIDSLTKNMVDEFEERNVAQRSKKGLGLRSGEGSTSGVVADVVGAAKKSKKKSESDEIMAIPKKDEPDGDHDAINVNEVNNEMVDDIRECKKTKKKKSNRHEVERTKEIVATTEKVEAVDHYNAFNRNKVNNEMVDGRAESKKTKRKKKDSLEAERTKEIVATAEKREADGDHNALNVNKVKDEIVVGHEDTKKTRRKKRDRHEVKRIGEIVAITEKDDFDGDHNAFNVNKVKNEMVDGSENTKKTKWKKRGNHEAERTVEFVEIAEKAEADGNPNVFHVNNVENEMVYGSEKIKKSKVKKKDRHEVERSDGTVRIGMEVESHSNIQNDDHGEPDLTVKNEGQEQKKHKKKNKKKNELKEERESGSIRNAEQRVDVIVNNVVENGDGKERREKNANDISDGNKHKKKQTCATEESTHGDKIEVGAAKKKDSRKRKHERSADGEFNVEEIHKSKKKRT